MAENRLTHAEIVTQVAEKTQIAKKYVKEVIEAATGLLRHEILAGRQFTLHTVGIFKLATRAPRKFKNPLTGADVKKPSANVLKFRIAKDFKDLLNA
jgi:DNA-binding protein HU-beta